MQYKLVAIDVDGTLVNEKKEMTQETINVIKRLIDSDVYVTIASGRPLSGLTNYLEYFKNNCPIITYNGAKVVLENKSTPIYEESLSKYSSLYLIDFASKRNQDIIIWSNDKLYSNSLNDSIIYYESTSGVRSIVLSFQELKVICSSNVTKMIMYGDNDKLKMCSYEIKEDISKSTGGDNKDKLDINMEFSSDNYLEFFSGKAAKGNALDYLCKYLNIDKEEVIAIGDNYNDLSMIEYAGLGIAMGNAPDDVKKRSDLVTLSNEDNGLSFIINKLFEY